MVAASFFDPLTTADGRPARRSVGWVKSHDVPSGEIHQVCK